MNEEEYIKDRIEDQINWYSDKSGYNQKRFKLFRVCNIIFAVSIPFLTGLINEENDVYLKIIIGVLGVLIAVIEGIMGLYKYQENWVKYRQASEALKSMLMHYKTRTSPFNGTNRFNLLVEMAETVMTEEHQGWANAQLAEKKDAEDDQADPAAGA